MISHKCYDRSGVETVMRFKNLKAITVKGSKIAPVADVEAVRRYAKESIKILLRR